MKLVDDPRTTTLTAGMILLLKLNLKTNAFFSCLLSLLALIFVTVTSHTHTYRFTQFILLVIYIITIHL